MPHKKGHTNNPNGRPKGSVNKRTAQWLALGEFITEEGAQVFMDNLGNMMTSDDKNERHKGMEMFIKTLEYFKPKLNKSDIKHETDGPIEITLDLGNS